MKFTEQQLAAVDISRCELDACVVAGPGSGKITVSAPLPVDNARGDVHAGVTARRVGRKTTVLAPSHIGIPTAMAAAEGA